MGQPRRGSPVRDPLSSPVHATRAAPIGVALVAFVCRCRAGPVGVYRGEVSNHPFEPHDHHHGSPLGYNQNFGPYSQRRRFFGRRYRGNNWGPPVPGTESAAGRTILIVVLVGGSLLALIGCLVVMFAMFQ